MGELYRFSEDNQSCVIRNPETPRHWYNYLWNESGYCAQVSQLGHGRSYYLNEKAQMCRVNDNDARYLYLRDEEDASCWNIGEGPLNRQVEDYRCVHHIGHSTLQSERRGIAASWRIFVPCQGSWEVWSLRLENRESRRRRLSVFAAVSFSLEGFSYPRYYEMYRCMQAGFDRELNGIYCDSSHPFAPHDRYQGFLASSEEVQAFDADLARFCGTANTMTREDASACALFQQPDVVVKGRDCTNSEAALFILGGVLQHKLVLEPGERREITFVFGVCSSREEARRAAAYYRDPETVEKEFQRALASYEGKYGTLSVRTPDKKIDALMNNWVKKQADFCIVGKKGVRDNLQIAVALLSYRQEKARAEILECLKHQFRDGHAVLTWYPYDDTRYSDQPFWIIWAVCQLIRETGDRALLQERIPWQDGGEGSVLEHVKAAAARLIGDKGRRGLVRIYFADWNDALNITTDPEAESVMLSCQFCLALQELRKLAEEIGDGEYAAYLEREYVILKDAVNREAWDGGWYVRALSREGKIGSRESEGSRIYLNAQTWAVLGGVAEGERLEKVLEAVDGMEQDFGFPLNMPPYESYSPLVGRMSGMLPGLFENGGVYCHATGFKILMDCKTGRGDKALETLKKIMPDSEKNPSRQSGAEPYVFTNCYGTHPDYYGKSYQSWTTGTSAWAILGLYEGILGIQRDYGGLRVAPCFPAKWERAEVRRRFRGAEYHIVIRNPERVRGGVPRISVDGVRLEGNLLPDFRDGETHEIDVLLGEKGSGLSD